MGGDEWIVEGSHSRHHNFTQSVCSWVLLITSPTSKMSSRRWWPLLLPWPCISCYTHNPTFHHSSPSQMLITPAAQRLKPGKHSILPSNKGRRSSSSCSEKANSGQSLHKPPTSVNHFCKHSCQNRCLYKHPKRVSLCSTTLCKQSSFTWPQRRHLLLHFKGLLKYLIK